MALAAAAKYVAITCALLLLLGSYLNMVERLFYNNDGINNLAGGVAVAHPNPALDRIYSENIELCAEAYELTSAQRRCRDYQRFIRSDLFFAHPFYSLYGWRLTSDAAPSAFPEAVHRALFWAGFVQILIAALIIAGLLVCLPAAHATVFSGALIVGFVSVWHIAPWSSAVAWPGGIDLTRITGTVGSGWAKPAVLIAGMLAAPAAIRLFRWAILHGPAWLVPGLAAAALLLYGTQFEVFEGSFNRYAGAALAALGLSPDLYGPLVSIAALLLFMPLLAGIRTNLSATIAGTGTVLLFFSLSTEPRSFWPQETIWSRQVLQLVFAVWIAVASVSKSRTIALFALALPVFHLAVASMFALVVAVGEAALCLRNRQFTPLLTASLVTLAGTQILMLGLWERVDGNQMAGFAVVQLLHMPAFHHVVSTDAFQASAATAAVLVSIAVWSVWRCREEEIVPRAAYYLAVAIIISALSKGLNAVPGFDGQLEPGVWAFISTDNYLAPGLCLAAVLMTLTIFVPVPVVTDAKASPAPAAFAVPVLAIAMLFVARIDIRPLRFDSIPATLHRFIDYGVAGAMDPRFSRALGAFRLDDDVYYLSRNRPTNSPVVYMSVLKARIRDNSGSLEPEAMRFVVLTE